VREDEADMTRTALITGATGGLGGAVVERFASEGWDVLGVDKRPAEDRENVRFVEADLFDSEAVDDAVAQAGADLRAVVNLVGGFAQGGRVHETPIEEFERQFTLNLRPTYLVTAAAIPRMSTGTVVCVGTRAALRPFPGAAGYVASKAALLAFVRALDAEYRDEGIRTNAVLPSVIDTPANRTSMPDADHEAWVAPGEIAEVIHFLSSDGSSPISGAEIPVYGRA
jgi:NAD(P)-dependent dehydrogenase (short-subunit alcohol dehydrogenase family)